MDDVLSEFNVLRKQQELVADIDLTPQGVFKRLISSGLQIAYPNVCTLYRIFLTLPITSATVERSMSKLKLIKNYLRSTMADDRLTALALIFYRKRSGKNIKLSRDHINICFYEGKKNEAINELLCL